VNLCVAIPKKQHKICGFFEEDLYPGKKERAFTFPSRKTGFFKF
jgi:hypothetical protein